MNDEKYSDSCIRCKAYDICKAKEKLTEAVHVLKTEQAVRELYQLVATNCRYYERDDI